MSAAVSSTAPTLWATASKEWVIQPKPKPGRKPKKDPAPSTADTDVDGKGRRVQNRAAQRAFRERKQSQLAELQARVQSYEQGEIERNVALQNIAKRLKEENETLRKQNKSLQEKVAKAESERDAALANNKKRPRDESPASTSSSLSSRKKSRIISDAQASQSPAPPSYNVSTASTPESNEAPETPQSPVDHDPSFSSPNLANLIDFSTASKPSFDTPFPPFGCGFCSEDTPCVCREVVIQSTAPPSSFKLERFDDPDPILRMGSPPPSVPSILDNLPAYQPAVPLRRRPLSTNVKEIFPVSPLRPKSPLHSDTIASCSGDPDNCLACAGDTFGKAFCAAISQSVASQEPCVDCPCAQSDALGRPEPRSAKSDQETIPTNDAWQQLKSHPNVAFSDLSLLADVVARRSKCTGPRVVISPAPGSITPERSISPPPADGGTRPGRNALRISGRASPPRLVPEEELLRCGQRRVREVQAAGVRDALRLLDAKFS